MKSILILSILMYISLLSAAQQVQKDSLQPAIIEKKWSFSVSLGANVIGAGSALNREMKEIGFGDYPPDYNFFNLFTVKNNQEYPQVKKSATWDIEGRYNLSKNSALAFSLGKSHHYRVDGFSSKGYQGVDINSYEYYLTIVHDVWFVSADYVFRYAPGYGGIAVGPVMAMHRVSEGPSTESSVQTNTLKPGFHVGVDLPLFQKKSWFMSFGLNYTWLPPTDLSPNAKNFYQPGGSPLPGGQSSGNKTNSIPLATFQMGVTTGWRF